MFGKKKRAKSSKKLAKRILKQSEDVVKRINKETEPQRKWDAIFEACYPLWQKGEASRKAGDVYTAIGYYEQARQLGYTVPALYESYAMAYRKMGDIPNEIAIIEEGIERLTEINGKAGDMSTGLRTLNERLVKAKAKLN